jgi:hypothetical protein
VAAKSPSNLDFAWAAGFIDGEGCFRYDTTPRLTVSNTHLPTLRWLKRLFGVGSVSASGNHRGRPQFRWLVSGENAIEVIEELVPYLREKKPQAQLVLDIREREPSDRAELKKLLTGLKRPSYALKQHRH